MNIFLEKLEKSKSPFLQDYENDIIEFYEKKHQKHPFQILLECYAEDTPISNIDKMYKFQSEIDMKYKNRMRQKKQFRRFLDYSTQYFKNSE